MSKSLIYHTLINTHGEVLINTSDKVVVSTRMEGLARNGLMLHCDSKTLDNLFPRTSSISPKQSQTLDISFGLAEVGKIEAQCEVISVRRLAKDTFELDLRFSEVNDRAIHVVDHYVERKLRQQVAAPSLVNRDLDRKVA
jgi:hypothetical protein